MSYIIKDKVKVGIFGFTGCAGDQLVIIHDEDRILEYFNSADIRSFVMASSQNDERCDLDVAIVEGSINTMHEIDELQKIRERSTILVAIGNCAVHGGVQAGIGIENWKKAYEELYDGIITLTDAFPPKPISDIVKVDLEINGCPVDKDQIYYAFSKLIHGFKVVQEDKPVCEQCIKRENDCLLNKEELCMGPVTQMGCNAACPSNNRICMGCYGLYKGANLEGFITKGKDLGFSEQELKRRMLLFGGKTMINKLEVI